MDDYPFDLGSYTRPVTTTSEAAQLWFNRGLIWCFAYNHEEAIECFQKAIAADDGCIMAYWGIAYALGPNYNKPWEEFEDDEKPQCLKQASSALKQANSLLERSDGQNYSSVEKALVVALCQRYPKDEDAGVAIEDFSPFNDTFANAMRQVYHQHSSDLDVCALFTEAIMNRTPWQLWDLKSNQPVEGADTLEAVTVLETLFQNQRASWEHAGLLHMYIHLIEMSGTPERALRHGDALVSLVPDAGHLVHMGTHIDVLCGDYHNVVVRNQAAALVDKKFVKHAGANNFYSIYRCHNYHFVIYGAMFLGQPGPALDAANALQSSIPAELLASLPDWFEAFCSMKQHVLIRFGMWKDLLDQELPANAELFSVTTAMMRYSRTVALANLRRIAEAEAERDRFREARAVVQDSRMLFNNTCKDLLEIAEQMMLGELEYHKGNHTKGFDHLRKSVHLDDNLPYDEPWGWMQPTRHALGALLIEKGQYQEAEAVYRADLGLETKDSTTLPRACQHPGNVWSLHGLYECLSHRQESVEILYIQRALQKAKARCHLPIRASCFCRQSKSKT